MTSQRSEMIKFVLISITTVLVILGIYTYSNQEDKKSISVSSISEKNVEIRKTENISPQTQKVKEKKSSSKDLTEKSPKVISQELTKEVETKEEIGKGLTLESIESADASEEAREQMIDDMAFYQSLQPRSEPSLNEEEILNLILQDLTEGSI